VTAKTNHRRGLTERGHVAC